MNRSKIQLTIYKFTKLNRINDIYTNKGQEANLTNN